MRRAPSLRATVTITSVQTGVARSVKTDGAGVYDIEELPPQDYKVSVTAAGFAPTNTGVFNVAVGSANKINAKLSVEQSNEQVEVTADSLPGINIENARCSRTSRPTRAWVPERQRTASCSSQ